MSNLTHLMHLKKHSIESWNHWRQQNPDLHPDLSDAFLCAIGLAAANLSEADLRRVDFYSADLWGVDLSRSDLRGASLGSANLANANLAKANLSNADLSSANLSQGNLQGASLRGVNLSMSHLVGADLSHADLTEANLKGANLTDVILTGATLSGTNLTGVIVSDLDIQVIATLQRATCEHVYVLSCVNPDAEEKAISPYTDGFRAALKQFYQTLNESNEALGHLVYRIAWPSTTLAPAPDIYLQSVERQANGDLLVRVGVPSLKAPPEQPQSITYAPLGHEADAYYRQQIQLREDQLATIQRQNDELLDLLKLMSQRNVYVQSVSVLENNLMTGVSKYDLRGANIGNFADTIEAGGRQQAVQRNQSASQDTIPDWELVVQVESLFQQLSAQAAQVPPAQRPQVVGNALQKQALSNPAFKTRLLKALESGSGELVRVFAQNPYISVPLALVKGWMSVSPAAAAPKTS
ncbi:MAG: pentapeptide repeat-containing protein [Spirulina sp.]